MFHDDVGMKSTTTDEFAPGVVSAGSARLPARSSSSSGSSRSLPSPPPGRGGCRIPEPTPRYSDIHRAAPASRPGPRSAAGPPLFSSLLLLLW